MTIKIKYSKKISNRNNKNIVLFSNDKFKIDGLRKYLSNSEFSYIRDLLKTSDLKKFICI